MRVKKFIQKFLRTQDLSLKSKPALYYASLLSRVSLCNPMTVAHKSPLSMGILQARILEWVIMPSSRGSSQPRDRTQVSWIAGRFFTTGTTREAQEYYSR